MQGNFEKDEVFRLSRPAKEILAGSTGALMQVFTGQPFDMVKVRMQSSKLRTTPI
jgi:hypothetical protein